MKKLIYKSDTREVYKSSSWAGRPYACYTVIVLAGGKTACEYTTNALDCPAYERELLASMQAPPAAVCDCGRIEHGRHHQCCPVTLEADAKMRSKKH